MGGSHRQWAEAYQQHSRHTISILGLQGRHWKWRMYGGAVTLAKQFIDSNLKPDLVLATDMLDLSTFLALTRQRTHHLPTVLYFHENQITYPWSPTDQDVAKGRNNQYGFINYTSALAADRICFNSSFHQEALLAALPDFLRQFPDHREAQNTELLREKSVILPLGMNLHPFDALPARPKPKEAILLWNHRWEYDKGPDLFFNTVFRLAEEGLAFKLIILGRDYHKAPPIFKAAKEKLKDRMLHFGYATDREEYGQWLKTADLLPVTSQQDFFGGSTVEAIYCGCYPILPDRLAYPGHIPEDLRAKHLYQKPEEFYLKLRTAILSIQEIRQDKSYPNFVGHYDWSILAPQYDDFFDRFN